MQRNRTHRPSAKAGKPGALYEKFIYPPFTVLDARSGWWAQRKSDWLARGLDSGDGRSNELLFATSSQPPNVYAAKNKYEAELGRPSTWSEFLAAHPDLRVQKGTSIFDPVLAELLVRWFSPRGGLVIDPFAGGSVRGAVAAICGRRYVGLDLSAAQIEANRAQWPVIDKPKGIAAPQWICADSQDIRRHISARADFILSCPPYFDLERYSDSAADLSNMTWGQFMLAYRTIIERTVSLLKPGRFAAWVVGDVRDKKGLYRNLTGVTVDAFAAAGAPLYNEAVLVTSLGSLPVRAGRTFAASRKLGKTHQQVFVFAKGDPREAAKVCMQGGL